ncbi:hypothetical protein FQR65_LT04723 [Abscondita terminalis]|nr:hypothetical protein FQR65_LT04723 [Abscondita terminalis]
MVNLWEEGQNDKRSDNKCFNNKLKLKRSKNRGFKIQIKGLRDLVQNLENSLSASEVGEKQLFRQFESESVKNISVVAQLNDARKENKHLLNILQQKCLEKHPTRSHTDYGSSCSTMSMVNLQYNYEELLNNHENLLKLLAIKDKDMERLCIESGNIYKKASELSSKLITCESLLKKLCSMYIELKEKKDLKIFELKNKNETLNMVHNQLVTLLNKQYMESDHILTKYLQNESTPQKALLLQEVKRANKLYHENILLKRELTCLKGRRMVHLDT